MLQFYNKLHNYHKQSFPDDSPNLAQPTLDRLDFHKLSMPAGQYRTRCGISEASQKWWIEFLEHLQQFCYQENQHSTPIWPMQQLIEKATVTENEIIEKGVSLPILQESESLPAHIRRVYEKECGSHPPVSRIIYNDFQMLANTIFG